MAKLPRTTADARARTAADPDISRVDRGLSTTTTAGMTEDQRRAEGTDASQAAGPHDESPEATRGQVPGGYVDQTYTGNAGGYHGNVAGEPQPLVPGQAPVGRAAPMRGSDNHNERFHPAVPNAINQSPVLHGFDADGKRVMPPKTFADQRRELHAQDDGPEAVAGEGTVEDEAAVA